jgi:hypothetical protein
MTLDDLRTDRSYVALALDALSSAQTSAAAGGRFTASTPVSVDAWIRFNGLPANTMAISQAGVFAFGSQGPAVYFQFNGLPIVLSDPTQAQIHDDTWHYVCATFDGGMVRLYIDGQFNTGQSCMGLIAANANPVVIGQGVQGLVRRVRIYNTALNAATVLANMYGTPTAGTLAADFDCRVNPPVDLGPSAYPISLQANAAMIKVSPAVSLGTVGFIRPMGEKNINPGGAHVDPYTVQTWVYASSAVNPVQALFVNSDITLDTGMALLLQYDSTVSAFRVVSQRGSNTAANQTLTSLGTVAVGTWTNVATTFDGAALSLYINGVLDSTKACPPITVYSQFSDLLIGAAIAQGIPSGATTLQGYIREVDVWSVALSAADVATYMATPPDINVAGLSAAYTFTNSPARNLVNGHPIGLAEGAVLSGQLGPAPISQSRALEDAPLPEMGLDPERMAAIRAGLNFADLHQRHRMDFDDAMASDIAAFDDAKDKALIESAWTEARRKLAEEPTALPFLVTEHKIDGERLIIVHRPSGSYVAYRAAAGDIDDCTMWKVRLVFTAVGGIIDAITGVGSTLGDKAIVMIGRVLTIPRVATQMASGAKMTAAGIFVMLSATYTMGLLRPLILVLIDVGFWTLVRVVANLLAVAAGFGTARIFASLAATVVTFIKVYLEKPASCDPLPVVSLTSIAFDYDPTRAAIQALTIRRNFGNDVPVPEWVPGKTAAKDAPCAYAIASLTGTPTIRVVLGIPATTTHAVKIQATGGGILGAIDPIAVSFTGTSATVTLSLSHHSLTGGGVQRADVTWTWQYQVDGGAWANMATTNHRVYVILTVPTQPWQQGALRSNQQLPWADVLDYACVWAKGATTVDGALSLVTPKVNSGINLIYDTVSGVSYYTASTAGTTYFLCGLFVDFLTTGKGNGRIVACSDCATIVTSFANILGANIFTSVMLNAANPSTGFACNQILAIGTSAWAVPFGTGFSYHEVAWTGTATYPDVLYDACLQYDTGTTPWGTGPHTAGLPVKVPFSTLGAISGPFVPLQPPFTATSYRERLAANTSTGIPRCVPVGQGPHTNSGRRPVT